MREVGPVRFLLGNSPEEVNAARPYMGIARTQLGIAKNLMNLGGLQQYARTVQLSDGTIIHCQSVLGQDFVSITPAAVPAAARTTEVPAVQRVQVEQVQVLRPGAITIVGQAAGQAARWVDGAFELLPDRGEGSEAISIADDGTVMGMVFDTNGDAFLAYWSVDGALTDTGLMCEPSAIDGSGAKVLAYVPDGGSDARLVTGATQAIPSVPDRTVSVTFSDDGLLVDLDNPKASVTITDRGYTHTYYMRGLTWSTVDGYPGDYGAAIGSVDAPLYVTGGYTETLSGDVRVLIAADGDITVEFDYIASGTGTIPDPYVYATNTSTPLNAGQLVLQGISQDGGSYCGSILDASAFPSTSAPDVQVATKWVDGVRTDLAGLGGLPLPWDICNGGTRVVGTTLDGGGTRHAVRWDGTAITSIASSATDAVAPSITPDGRFIAGYWSDAGFYRSFIWSEAAGRVTLTPSGAANGDQAMDVSDDGSIVIGRSRDGRVVVWTDGVPATLALPLSGANPRKLLVTT